MIAQITPLVKAAGWKTWLRVVLAHSAFSALSGGLVGLCLGVMGSWIFLRTNGAVYAVLGGTLMATAAREFRVLKCALPGFQRQTPRWFLQEFGPVWGAAAWGADLGQGWTTRVEVAGIYSILAISLFTGRPVSGLFIMGAFGLARSLPVVLAGLLTSRTEVGTLANTYLVRWPSLRVVNGSVLAGVGAWILMSCALAVYV